MIEFQDVAYSYGDNALMSDVTLTLQPGSFHFLTGPSGAGKTTLLRLCYADMVATSGRINLFGQDVRHMQRNDIAEVRQKIGVVHQDCQFLDHLDLADNVALPLMVSGRETRVDEANLQELLDWVGLSAQSQAMPPELSGGERQRAALARAVIMSPEVLIADEPTGNVDWDMSMRLLNLMIELNRMGKTVLVATHDLNLIRAAKAQLQARVLRIRDGQVQASGADL